MIAFERRLWMMDKFVDMYSIACSLITNKIHHVCGIINRNDIIRERTASERGIHIEAWGLLFRVLVDYMQANIEVSGVRACYYS